MVRRPASRTPGQTVAGLAPAAAFAGFVAAVVSGQSTGAVVAIVVVSGLLFPMTWLTFGRLAEPEDRRFLAALLLWAIAGRYLAFAVVRGLIDPVLLAPDAFGYEQTGWGIVNYWRGLRPGLPGSVEGTVQVAFPYTNAVLFYVFGRVPEAVATVNLYMSVWTVAIMYRIARLVVPDRRSVAKVSSVLFAFFPSIILWSVLNIREAPMILLLSTAVLLFLRLQNAKSRALDVPLLLAVLAAILFYRQYMAALVGVSALIGLFVSFSRSPARALTFGGMVLVVGMLAAQSAGIGTQLTSDPTTVAGDAFAVAQELRVDMARGASSSFVQDSDVSSVGGAAAFLPVGLTYFLLAPFPWALGSLLQVITLPETLVWYGLFPFGLLGVLICVRRRLLATVIPLMVIGTVCFSYALVQGNVGTAFRHRSQILPLLLVMVAIGLVNWVERRRARKAQVARRSAQARAQMGVPPSR